MAEMTMPAPLDMKAHHISWGNKDNVRIYYQNRLLYLANGRIITAQDLKSNSDLYEHIPAEVRNAYIAVADSPQVEPAPDPFKPKTPQEVLDALDATSAGHNPQVWTRRDRGLIFQQQVPQQQR